MIAEEDSQVRVEIGRYEGRIEYRINFSRENIEYAKAGCPGSGRLIGMTEESIRSNLDKGKTFDLYLDNDGKVSKEIGIASEHNIHTIFLGDTNNLEDTIEKFQHVPIVLPKHSGEKIIIGYVTLVRDEK